MLENKRCPKCGGILFIDKEKDGSYEWCVNCSYRNATGVVVENDLMAFILYKKNPNGSEKNN